MFKPVHMKTLTEATDSVNSVSDSSPEFQDSTVDVPIVEEEIVEENGPWYIRYRTSRINSGLSLL